MAAPKKKSAAPAAVADDASNQNAQANANVAAGVSDFLDDLAMKAKPAGKVKKKGDESVQLDEKLSVTLDRWMEAVTQYKDLEGVIAECEQDIFTFAEAQRIANCIATRAFHGSLRIRGENAAATYITKNAYTGCPVENRAEMISAVAEYLLKGKKATTAEDAEAKATQLLASRLEWVPKVGLDPAAFKDPEAMTALREHLAKYLIVSKTGYPTEEFHEGSSLSPSEQEIRQVLIDGGFLKHHKASLRPSN